MQLIKFKQTNKTQRAHTHTLLPENSVLTELVTLFLRYGIISLSRELLLYEKLISQHHQVLLIVEPM